MAESIYIPDHLKMTFKRLLYRVPKALRDDVQLQKTLLVYLKFGGEKLAHHCIKKCELSMPDEATLIKHKLGVPSSPTQENNQDEQVPGEDAHALG